jgi:DNA-binding beta-propeller fold protein YncE
MDLRTWLIHIWLAGVLLSGLAVSAPFAYIPNTSSKSVSVIGLTTNAVVGLPIPVGDVPRGIAVNSAGTRVFVTNEFSNSVSVIDTATNKVLGAPMLVGTEVAPRSWTVFRDS